MENKKRIEFIDLAKGICILLVVIGHVGVPVTAAGLESMRMPLYFILSGLFYKDYGGFVEFLVKKINKILIPFLFFYIGSYILFYAFDLLVPGLIKTDAKGILDVFTQRQYFNGPIWFLLCLFWANVIFCGITLNVQKEWLRVVLVFAIGAVGVILSKQNIVLPCVIDASFTALPFFYFGYFLKKTPLLFPNKMDRYNLLFAIGFYLVALALELWKHPSVGFHYNYVQGNVVVLYVMSIASVMAVLYLCKIIKKLPFVSYFGRYSIIPLCLHHLIYRPIQLAVDKYAIGGGIYTTAILTVLVCWVCIPLCIKFLPYVTAQKDLIKLRNK